MFGMANDLGRSPPHFDGRGFLLHLLRHSQLELDPRGVEGAQLGFADNVACAGDGQRRIYGAKPRTLSCSRTGLSAAGAANQMPGGMTPAKSKPRGRAAFPA